MPIRDIIVDWDNGGVQAGNNRGKYKNRKPACQPNDTTSATSCSLDVNVTCTRGVCADNGIGVCHANILTFGNSPQACEEGFFEYNGSYLYDEENENCSNNAGPYALGTNPYPNVSEANLILQGMKRGDKYCVYRPKVVLIDNWGWCNGTDQNGRLTASWGDPDPTVNNCLKSATMQEIGTPFAGWVIVGE